jgi:hypothetical protein
MESPQIPHDTFPAQRNQVTGRYHSDNILSQIAALWDVDSHRKMAVHTDSACLQAAKYVTEYMDHNSLKRAPYPPYFSDLSPSDFYLFEHLKRQLRGREFTQGAELVSAISEILN